jgi:Do/DeqQ family serine protease
MSTNKLLVASLLSSIFGGLITLGSYVYWIQPNTQTVVYTQEQSNDNLQFSGYQMKNDIKDDITVPDGLNFISASEKVTPAVVHIKTFTSKDVSSFSPDLNDFFGEFFRDQIPQRKEKRGNGTQQQLGSGSGVIISDDGYIVTNNHVIENADRIEIVLADKRSFEGKLIGTDPTTDLALVKIEEKNLKFLPFANSDNTKIGQWVLAVGSPFDLTSTVTAGIISAKARSINILRQRSNLSVESFIQTDAAVNPGNSGGALVDLSGALIGINTAIASNTGSYTGYSFAVPSILVKKVVTDLKEFGEVQRGLMGVSIVDINAQTLKEFGLDNIEGVYVQDVGKNSGAEEAGIKKGDVILSVNGVNVNTVSELQELVARNRPGDKVKLTVKRDKKNLNYTVTLRNKFNTTEIVQLKDNKARSIEELGVELADVTDKEKEKLNLTGGVKVVKLHDGKLKATGMKEGFIITKIDKRPVGNLGDLQQFLSYAREGVLIEGVYPDGKKAYYGLGF